MAAGSFCQWPVVDAPLEKLLLVEFGQAEGWIVHKVVPWLTARMLHAVLYGHHLQIAVLFDVVCVFEIAL